MAEDKTESLNGNLTNPTPFEEFVRQQFELLHNRMAGFEEAFEGLKTEMVERFVQVSRQIIEVKEQVKGVKEDVKDLDYKVDAFVREHIHLKRELRELQESLAPKN